MRFFRRHFFVAAATVPAVFLNWSFLKESVQKYKMAGDIFSKDQVRLKSSSSQKAGFCFIKSVECPETMSYEQYLSQMAQWTDWTRLDRFILESLDNGDLLEIDFKFDGKSSLSKMYFQSPDSFDAWMKKVNDKSFFTGMNPEDYNQSGFKIQTQLQYLT